MSRTYFRIKEYNNLLELKVECNLAEESSTLGVENQNPRYLGRTDQQFLRQTNEQPRVDFVEETMITRKK